MSFLEEKEAREGYKRLGLFAAQNIYQLFWYFTSVAIAPRRRMKISARAVSNWSRKLAYALNIEVVKESEIPQKPGLIISNHSSYHDIPAIGLLAPIIFVSKKSVMYLPVYGQAAWIVGIIFLDRQSEKSRKKTVEAVQKRLSEGLFVVNFAEGTTSPCGELRPFKKGLFHTLLGNADIPIYPLRLKYENPDFAWVGKEPMRLHFERTQKLGKAKIYAKFMPPVYGSQFSTAEEFAEAVRGAIKSEL